jgi:hypothetical protein
MFELSKDTERHLKDNTKLLRYLPKQPGAVPKHHKAASKHTGDLPKCLRAVSKHHKAY